MEDGSPRQEMAFNSIIGHYLSYLPARSGILDVASGDCGNDGVGGSAEGAEDHDDLASEADGQHGALAGG